MHRACLNFFRNTLQGLHFSRLLWSAFLHADEMHLFYNMSSLLWKVWLIPLCTL